MMSAALGLATTASLVVITRSRAFTPTPSCPAHPVPFKNRQGDSTTQLFNFGGLSRAYNDNALYDFHQFTQQEKISGYEGSSTYVNTDELWDLAWHDAFVRNDLSDFVPPLTDNLQVLILGDENDGDGDLMDELSAGDKKASSATLEASDAAGTEDGLSTDGKATDPSSKTSNPAMRPAEQKAQSLPGDDGFFSRFGSLFNPNIKNKETGAPKSAGIELASYDCILDRGLMSQLLATQQKESCNELLLEATKRIREHGVYILQSQPLDEETKTYLTNIGDLLGLQWQFALDGISDDAVCVSVARKYFVDELPSMGKLVKLT